MQDDAAVMRDDPETWRNELRPLCAKSERSAARKMVAKQVDKKFDESAELNGKIMFQDKVFLKLTRYIKHVEIDDVPREQAILDFKKLLQEQKAIDFDNLSGPRQKSVEVWVYDNARERSYHGDETRRGRRKTKAPSRSRSRSRSSSSHLSGWTRVPSAGSSAPSVASRAVGARRSRSATSHSTTGGRGRGKAKSRANVSVKSDSAAKRGGSTDAASGLGDDTEGMDGYHYLKEKESLKTSAGKLLADANFTMKKLNDTDDAASAKKVKTHDLPHDWKSLRDAALKLLRDLQCTPRHRPD